MASISIICHAERRWEITASLWTTLPSPEARASVPTRRSIPPLIRAESSRGRRSPSRSGATRPGARGRARRAPTGTSAPVGRASAPSSGNSGARMPEGARLREEHREQVQRVADEPQPDVDAEPPHRGRREQRAAKPAMQRDHRDRAERLAEPPVARLEPRRERHELAVADVRRPPGELGVGVRRAARRCRPRRSPATRGPRGPRTRRRMPRAPARAPGTGRARRRNHRHAQCSPSVSANASAPGRVNDHAAITGNEPAVPALDEEQEREREPAGIRATRRSRTA